MGEVTVNQAVLFERIESALSRYAGMIDYLEKVSEYDCEKTEDREILGLALASLELLRPDVEEDYWYEVSDGINRFTTDDWDAVVEAVTGWHNCLMDESPEKEFPEPEEIFKHVLRGEPNVERLNALIEAWEAELIDCYGYIEFPVRVKRVSDIDAHSVAAV